MSCFKFRSETFGSGIMVFIREDSPKESGETLVWKQASPLLYEMAFLF